MKIWEKGIDINKLIEEFTIGKDPELDMHLAAYDILGTIAHIKMLQNIGLLSMDELMKLVHALQEIYVDIENKKFRIEENIEDIHSQVELLLTKKLGQTGKKVHSGR